MNSQRLMRLNELICHEFNNILRTVYRDVMLDVTVIDIQISPDLHDALVFVSVLGDAEHERKMLSLLQRHISDIRQRLFKKITIKYSPKMNLRLDQSVKRGQKVLSILDSIG